MPADPILIAEAQAWLSKAAQDLRAVIHSLNRVSLRRHMVTASYNLSRKH